MSFGYYSMTTITSHKSAELKSFPPITDTVVWIKQVDWADVRQRCRGGVNNVGLVLAVTGEKIHDLGAWLAEV
jgi:hypothetical protein